MKDLPVSEYVMSAIEDLDFVDYETQPTTGGKYIKVVPVKNNESTEAIQHQLQSFLESLPLSLRMAISFDVYLGSDSYPYILSVYISPIDNFNQCRELATTSIEQQYDYVSGIIEDLKYCSTQTPDISDTVSIPTIKWVTDDMFVVKQDLDSTILQPDTISRTDGNFTTCTSLTIEEDSNTLTYKFKNPIGTASSNPTEEQKSRTTQKNRPDIFPSHFVKCPSCSQKSVTDHIISAKRSDSSEFNTILECVNCGYVTVVKIPYNRLLQHSNFTTLQGFCENILKQPETLLPDERISVNVDAKETARTEYLQDKHRFTYNNTTYSVHLKEASYIASIEPEKVFVLTCIEGSIGHRFVSPNGWDNPNVIEDTEYNHEEVFCEFCAESKLFDTSAVYEIQHNIVPFTDLYIDPKVAKESTCRICEGCYTEFQSAIEYGVEKNSAEFLSETI